MGRLRARGGGARHLHFDLFFVGRVLLRVREQVEDDLFQRLRIGTHGSVPSVGSQGKSEPAALQAGSLAFHYFFRDTGGVYQSHRISLPAALARREIEHVVDEPCQALGFRGHEGQILRALPRVRLPLPLQQLNEKAYGREGRLELVRNIGDKSGLLLSEPYLSVHGVEHEGSPAGH